MISDPYVLFTDPHLFLLSFLIIMIRQITQSMEDASNNNIQSSKNIINSNVLNLDDCNNPFYLHT